MEIFIAHVQTGVIGPTNTILLLWSVFKESFALDQQPDFPKMANSSATMLEICMENRSLIRARNGTKPAFLGLDLLLQHLLTAA